MPLRSANVPSKSQIKYFIGVRYRT